MSYSFEKIPSEEKNPEPERTQEQFDMEIEKEADRLGVSLQELQNDINKYGGPEKFKEFFEKKVNGGNEAGMEISSHESNIRNEKQSAGSFSMMGGILGALDGLYVSGIDRGGDVSLENIKHPIDTITKAWENGWLDQAMVGMIALVAAISVGSFVGAIKHGIEAGKEKRKKKVDELKFKMTDTEVK